MKLIYVGGKKGSVIGNYAQVNDEDYEHLNQWRWYAHYSKNQMYVVRTLIESGKRIMLLMHRVILQLNDKKVYVDHKDHNGLNNQRSNLRICTPSQNKANKKNITGVSKYMGVSRCKDGWKAACGKNNKKYQKQYKTEMEAALWYNEKAKELHGEFAKLNIISEIDIINHENYVNSLPIYTTTHRTCKNCKLLKELNMFSKNKLGKNGLCSQCKICINDKHKLKRYGKRKHNI